jgi:hypothetical protein
MHLHGVVLSQSTGTTLPIVYYVSRIVCGWFVGWLLTGGQRRLHNEELHNLHASQNIIRVIKSRRLIWTGHVACAWNR